MGSFGGVSNVANDLGRAMAATGEVEFYAFSGSVRKGSDWIKEHIPMPGSSGLPVIDTFEAPLRAKGALQQAADKVKPDLVHMHTPALPPPKGVPSIVTVHGTYHADVPNLLKYPLSPGYKLFLATLIYSQYQFERHTLRYFSAFHPVSSMTADELKIMGVATGRISMVPNGVDVCEFHPEAPADQIYEKFGLNKEKLIFSVGTITPRKGAHVAVKAAKAVLKAHPDATFAFAGSWPRLGASYVNKMRKEVEKAGISDRIKFLGPVSHGDLKALYNACSVFLSASITEGCSLNILEAAACGKPIVSTDVGGARDVLGDLGFYAPALDSDALAAALVQALDSGKTYVPEIRNRIEKDFSWDKIARDMVDVYKKAATYK